MRQEPLDLLMTPKSTPLEEWAASRYPVAPIALKDTPDVAQPECANAPSVAAPTAAVRTPLEKLKTFIEHGRRQIDQICRRVLNDEIIPHNEKVFSLFQPHTEWINKGKAGVPVELGLRVCIIEDQYRFILHHQVMEKTTDDQVAVSIVEETCERFGQLESISMDKGFHSKENQVKLQESADIVVLPRKGKLSVVNQALQSEPEFVNLRHQHSAVESAINALESHGLDICRDHGISGFKRYVALAIVARNIQRLGAILRQQDAEQIRSPYKKAA